MAKYLVTGGAGFIGSHLVTALLEQGGSVRVLDNFSTGSRSNLEPLADDIELIEGDLRSEQTVNKAVTGVDYVLHQAALPSVPRSIEDPVTTNDVNVGGTLNVLNAARSAGVQRVVYASSSSVYGDNRELPKREVMSPRPISPYAVSKLAGEIYCQVFTRTYGLETVCLRYFNVFGPRQDPNSAYAAFIPKFAVGMLAGKPLTIHGDGEQSRDFTFIENVVEANLRALEAAGAAGQVFNAACGEAMSLNAVRQRLEELLEVSGNVSHGPPRPGDVPHSLAAIDRARETLGYHPAVTAREGLARTAAWYREATGNC